jgi:hypothetical protein
VTAPTTPFDIVEIADEAAKLLKIPSDDPEVADRIVPIAEAITDLITLHLVTVDDPVPAAVNQAAINATVELARRKDAPFGLTGAWGADGLAMRVDRDALSPVLTLLQPYRRGFGCG